MNGLAFAVHVIVAGAGASSAIPVDLGGLPPRSMMERRPDRPIPEWFRTRLRVGHLPPAGWHMVDEFIRAKYGVIIVNAMGHWFKVGPSADLYKPEEVREADAYLRRLTETIHRGGARSVLYIGPVQVPWLSKEMVAAHPDWLRIRASGKPDPTPNFANIRSGYGEWALRQLTYVTREYKVDGYWLDGYAPVHLHTYDEATKRAFREASGGKDIPKPIADVPDSPMYFDIAADPVAREYVAWHERFFVEFADRMRDAVRAGNPDAVIYANYSANRTWYFPDMAMDEYPASYPSAIDDASVELYWDVPGDPLYQTFVYAFVQGVTRERGASVWIQPSAQGIVGTSPPVEIQLRGIEGLPWGVVPEFVESARREEYKDIHAKAIAAREPWLVRTRAVSYVGIVASERTRALYGRAALPLYLTHALGAFRAIIETHWPVRILTEYDLEDGDLAGVRALVLPNVACLSDRSAEVIRRFVGAGGGLVATFETSLHDAEFVRRPDFALADLFHASYAATHAVAQRVEALTVACDGKHPIIDDPMIRSREETAWLGGDGPPPERGTFSLVASAAEVRLHPDGEAIASFRLSDPARRGVAHPAIIASSFGKGRVAYFAASADKAMFFFADAHLRRLIANACLWVARDAPPLEVKGPLILTATFREQPAERRHIVHLLNNASSWGIHSISQRIAPFPEDLQRRWGFPERGELRATWPVREEVIPLSDIRVTCRIPGLTRATLEPDHRELPIEKTPDGVAVTVPRLDLHGLVVFE